jgi:7-carboxy-7-deazaguanine synthase
MHGTNEITKPFLARPVLLVNSIWPTIQGEGPDAGRVSVFVRLAKCNLKCFFCDTEFDTGEWMKHEAVINHIHEVAKICKARLVVVTGGEPLLQNIVPLVEGCNERNLAVAVETAGTVYFKELTTHFTGGSKRWNGNMIVCSPKTPKISAELLPLIGAFKYIIRAGETSEVDGLPVYSTQQEGKEAKLYRPPESACVYVQPMDEGDPIKNDINLKAATLICMRWGYRLSVQVHKIAGMP